MKIEIDRNDFEELQNQYLVMKKKIQTRLAEFRNVHSSRYFYELCYCLLTPQSKAVHCDHVVSLFEKNNFLHSDFDPEPFLHPSQSIYVRFHKTKAHRLIALKNIFPELYRHLISKEETKSLRELLVRAVNGIGYKEASHFLRNIGRTDVTILDRHILKNFIRLKLIPEYPKSISRKKYFELEKLFEKLSERLHIPSAELDLLLWSNETGMILK